MDARELNEWLAFERVYGPLTVQERVDFAGALSAWSTSRAGGGQSPLESFIPSWEAVEQQETPSRPQQSPEELMGFMRQLQGRKRTRTRRPKG